MYAIFTAIVPVFLIILAGMAVERLEFLPENTGQVIGVFVVNVCMPALLFHVMSAVTVEQLAQGWWWLGQIGVQAILMALAYGLDRLRGVPVGEAVISGLSVSFPNPAFVGLPVIMNLLPGNREALTVAGLCLISTNLNCIVGQVVLAAWRKGLHGDVHKVSLIRRLLRGFRQYILGNPILMSICIGLAVALLKIPVWAPLDKAVSSIGYIAPTCMLFSLGFGLRRNFIKALKGGRGIFVHSAILSLCKLCIMPALIWFALAASGYTGIWLATSVIIAATGTGVITSVFGEVYQASPAESALTVTVTNLLSFFSLIVSIWLLAQAGVHF